MPKPYPLKLIIKVLLEKGFYFVSQTGSHGKEVRHGTFKSILRQAKLQLSDFENKK